MRRTLVRCTPMTYARRSVGGMALHPTSPPTECSRFTWSYVRICGFWWSLAWCRISHFGAKWQVGTWPYCPVLGTIVRNLGLAFITTQALVRSGSGFKKKGIDQIEA